MTQADLILYSVYIFVLAVFVGFEVISKVPVQLHTPLMSGTNAIHGIVMAAGFEAPGRRSSATGVCNPRWPANRKTNG